jgi:hypothetical protein
VAHEEELVFEALGPEAVGEGSEGADVLGGEVKEVGGEFSGEVLSLLGELGEVDDESVHGQELTPAGRKRTKDLLFFFCG